MTDPLIIARAQAIIQYQFNDSNLLVEALQSAGSGVTTIGGRPLDEGHKRLALFGDSVLKTVVLQQWYQTRAPRGV